MYTNYIITRNQDELMHYGILGMKWGVRRYENKDGTLTSAGKKRYGYDSVKSTVSSYAKTKQTSANKAIERNHGSKGRAIVGMAGRTALDRIGGNLIVGGATLGAGLIGGPIAAKAVSTIGTAYVNSKTLDHFVEIGYAATADTSKKK